jgi:hypothetical protein
VFLVLQFRVYDPYLFFYVIVYGSNGQQSIQWSGYQWYLRDQQNSGPGRLLILHLKIKTYFSLSFIKGPNNWNSSNVWVDSNQNLHLKLSYSSTNGWTCAELYSGGNFQFGTFRWFVEGAVDQLDPNVVLGLFTYGGVDGTNEIDIEFSTWGQTDPTASNLFYTVYPSALGVAQPVSDGTRISLQGTYTTNQFTWTSQHVASQIQGGFISGSKTKNLIFSYTTPTNFSSAMPYISAPVHMNLWCFQGKPPINGQEVEIIIHNFYYTKA